MSATREHKTAQTPVLAYAEAIIWTVELREEAERRREFDRGFPLLFMCFYLSSVAMDSETTKRITV